jgi:hypothetical protein
VWLAGLVVLSTALRFLIARTHPAPFIFQDELLYAELARSLGTTGHFALRGVEGTAGLGPVYPALISPAYALFDSVPQAYAAAKLLNALLMSLAAVPVYLIARRLLTPGPSLLAAALSLSIPWLEFTSRTMTENAFLPIFLLWFLALVLTLERPTLLRQLATFALLALAYGTRPQAVVLVPALVSALVLAIAGEAWFGEVRPRWRAALREAVSFWFTWLVLAVGTLLFVVVELGIRGQSASQSLFRAYATLGHVDYSVSSVLRWTLWEVAELDVATGVIPFAAFLVVVAAACTRQWTSRPLRAFAAGAFAVSVWLFFEIGAFVSSPLSHRIQDRPLFYIVPLFLIALVLWAWNGVGRTWPLTSGAAAVAAALPGVVPFGSFLDSNAVNDSFGLLNLAWFQQRFIIPDEELMAPIVLAALAGALIFLFARGRWALLAVLVVLAYFAVGNRSVDFYAAPSSRLSLTAGIQQTRDWVDRAVGRNADVEVLFTGSRDSLTLWENEYFNRSIKSVYSMAGRVDGLPQQFVASDPRSGVVKVVGGGPVTAQYVLTDTSRLLDGQLVAEDPGAGMALYRVNGPVRVAGALSGVYQDTWSGPAAAFTAYDCRRGTLTVQLSGDPQLQPKPQTIVASSGGRVVARAVSRPPRTGLPFRVPLVGSNGTCTVSFTVSPTAPIGAREVGIRFQDVRFRPTP